MGYNSKSTEKLAIIKEIISKFDNQVLKEQVKTLEITWTRVDNDIIAPNLKIEMK